MRDRDDPAWLVRRERGEPIDDIPAATRAPYERLTEHLAALPGVTPTPGWQARVLAEARRPARPPRRYLRLAIPIGAVLAAALVFLLVRPGREATKIEPMLTTDVIAAGAVQRGTTASLGDRLMVTARVAEQAELRVYSDTGAPLARCSTAGDPGCTVTRDGLRLEIPLATRGAVRPVLYTGTRVPAGASLDEDLAAAARANATTLTATPIIVQ